MFDRGVSDLAPLEQSLNCHSVTRVQQVCHSKSGFTLGIVTMWKMKLTPASPKSACKCRYSFRKAAIGLLSLSTEGRIKGSTLSLLLFRVCRSSSSGQVSSPSCCCLLSRNTGHRRAARLTPADVASLQKRSGTRYNLENIQAWPLAIRSALVDCSDECYKQQARSLRLQRGRQSKLSAKAV